ncbi:MAG: VOC family protein [Saprospiraceae bacterium]|nr:MAG: VOC family protein [Saprospiraceae bacterium]
MQINPYLTFNGNCREAMTFYNDCLGGTLTLQTIGESPISEKIPGTMKNAILQATLKKGALVLLATDMVNGRGLKKGNSVSLLLECSSEEEIRRVYYKLSEGGKTVHRLEETFWGALFGGLTDKYGNQWLLNYNRVVSQGP